MVGLTAEWTGDGLCRPAISAWFYSRNSASVINGRLDARGQDKIEVFYFMNEPLEV